MSEDRLREWAATRGYGLAIAGPEVVNVVKRKLEERRARGLIDAAFDAENLSFFRFLDGISLPGPLAMVMVAVPAPVHTLAVTAGGGTIETLIPPTYFRYRATFDDVLADMKANALPPGSGAETLVAPLKSLAAHMGLVAYGRNNITYRPGLGSGHQLCGYAVALAPDAADVERSPAGQETMLDRCRDCRACLEACPTGAIRGDRFLISAERCFTLFSESRRPVPDLARLPKPACLIGCMTCQQVCPENKKRLRVESSGVALTGDETAALLEAGKRLAAESGEGVAPESDSLASEALASARAKIARLGLTEDIDVMGRNLGLFLGR